MLVRSLVIPLPFLIVPTGSNPSLSLEEGIVIHLIGQTFSVDTRSGSTAWDSMQRPHTCTVTGCFEIVCQCTIRQVSLCKS